MRKKTVCWLNKLSKVPVARKLFLAPKYTFKKNLYGKRQWQSHSLSLKILRVQSYIGQKVTVYHYLLRISKCHDVV